MLTINSKKDQRHSRGYCSALTRIIAFFHYSVPSVLRTINTRHNTEIVSSNINKHGHRTTNHGNEENLTLPLMCQQLGLEIMIRMNSQQGIKQTTCRRNHKWQRSKGLNTQTSSAFRISHKWKHKD